MFCTNWPNHIIHYADKCNFKLGCSVRCHRVYCAIQNNCCFDLDNCKCHNQFISHQRTDCSYGLCMAGKSKLFFLFIAGKFHNFIVRRLYCTYRIDKFQHHAN